MFRSFLILATAIASIASAQECADAIDCGPISGPFLPNGTGPGECTREYRLAGAQQIIFAYNRIAPGESAAGFQRLPLRDDCKTFINANGAPGIPVAIDRTTTYDFALATRQVFSRVTGQYTDFDNGTTIIHTNVTLGLLHGIALPVTFYADVFLFYDLSQCLMQEIRAFATVPTQVGGVPIQPPIIDQLTALSPLYKKEKRAVVLKT